MGRLPLSQFRDKNIEEKNTCVTAVGDIMITCGVYK